MYIIIYYNIYDFLLCIHIYKYNWDIGTLVRLFVYIKTYHMYLHV